MTRKEQLDGRVELTERQSYAADYTYFISFLLETRENGQGLPEGESPGPVSYSEYLYGYRMVP